MKSILISLLVIVSTQVKAQNDFNSIIEPATKKVSAPIFANLSVESVTRNMTTINPFFKNVGSASVTFNNKNLSLTINRRMPACLPNMMCAQVMPAPLFIELEIQKISRTACSVVYTAATPKNVRAKYYETVVVEDFSQSVCTNIVTAPGTLTYSVKGLSSLSKQVETAKAKFIVNEFIRAQ